MNNILGFRMLTKHILENLTTDEKDIINTSENLKLIIDEGCKYDKKEMIDYKYNKYRAVKTSRNVVDFKKFVYNLFIKELESSNQIIELSKTLRDIVDDYCREELERIEIDIVDKEFVKEYLKSIDKD